MVTKVLQIIALIFIVFLLVINTYGVNAQAPPSSGFSRLENKTLTNSTNNTHMIPSSPRSSGLSKFETDNTSQALPTNNESSLPLDAAPPLSGVSELENKTNHSPIANAGQDQIVKEGDIIILVGSKSKDPDIGDLLTYSWKQVGGPSVVINGADTSFAAFTAPKDISSDTDMKFELTVTDSKNATNSATVKVIVKPNRPTTLSPSTVPSSGVSKLETDNSSQSISTNNQSSLPEPQILNNIPSSGLSRLEGRLYTNNQSDIGNLTNQTSPH